MYRRQIPTPTTVRPYVAQITVELNSVFRAEDETLLHWDVEVYTERMDIKFGSQDNIDDYPAGVMHILGAIGHPEALVTDDSEVRDFGCFTDESEKPMLDALEVLLGRRPASTERIWDLAREFERHL